MITKKYWSEILSDWEYCKETCDVAWKDEFILRLYITFIGLIVVTPIIVILDLLLLPFEIGYYFFKRALYR